MEAKQVCARCGVEGHRAAEWNKSFFKVTRAFCKKSGHVQAQCRKAWAEGQAALRAERERAQEAFEDRRAEAAMRRETAQEAFEDRQRIERAEAAMRRETAQEAFEDRQRRRIE